MMPRRQAHTSLCIFRRPLSRCLQLPRERLKGLFLGYLPTVLVDDSIAQQAIEPGNSRFALLKVALVLERAKIACLQDIFSQGRIRHAALDEGEKEFSLRQKFAQGCTDYRDFGQEGSFLLPG
jgi:hypothetical protein